MRIGVGMIAIKLDVRPMPSPRPRVYVNTTIMPKKYKEHKQFIALKLRAFKPFKRVPLEVEFLFGYKAAKSAAMNKYPVPQGDIDNTCKTYLDAMEGVLYENDTQVVKITARKMYSDMNFVFIKIKEFEDMV